jgi:hypothetical protein
MQMEIELSIASKTQIMRFICKERETASFRNKITLISSLKFKDAMVKPKSQPQHVLHQLISTLGLKTRLLL